MCSKTVALIESLSTGNQFNPLKCWAHWYEFYIVCFVKIHYQGSKKTQNEEFSKDHAEAHLQSYFHHIISLILSAPACCPSKIWNVSNSILIIIPWLKS